nr:amidohydrolase family protein [Roseburia inulinivorans]
MCDNFFKYSTVKLPDKKGSIADGKDADIVLLDAENDIADVFVGGNLIER